MDPITHIGLVPTLTLEEMAKVLAPQDIPLLLSGSTQMASNEAISPNHLRTLMEALNIIPVWGREGTMVYRFNFEGTVRVFMVVPDPAVDYIPADILEREWANAPSLVDLIRILLHVAPGDIVPEDHPEEQSIGFLCPEANKVWLLHMDLVTEALQGTEIDEWPQVRSLICTNEGRMQLASYLNQGTLMKKDEFIKRYGAITPSPRRVLSQTPSRYAVRFKIVGDV